MLQLTDSSGIVVLKRREQLPKKTSESLGAIEDLMKSARDKRVDLTFGGRRYASRLSPIADLR